jgi:CheY-like chemotaxis protein
MAKKMNAATAAEDWKLLAALNTLMAATLPQMAAQGPWSGAERAALSAGMNFYFTKPVSPAKLAEAMAKLR